MFDKITLSLAHGRKYAVYVAGDHVEIEGTIDGYTARLGSARWDGAALRDCTMPLRDDVRAAVCGALRRARAA